MFFDGSLQDGVTKAVQEQKLVLCFVTNDIGESLRWEAWLLNDPELRQKVEASSILLKLVAGSQEAGHLAAFCSLVGSPALIVIRNGIPTAHLMSPMEEPEFKKALTDALEGRESNDNTSSGNTSTQTPVLRGTVPQASGSSSSGYNPGYTSVYSATNGSNTASDSSTNPASLPTDISEEEQIRRAKKVAEIKKDKIIAAIERKRVLAQIESDRKERQARGAERRAILQEEREQEYPEIEEVQGPIRRTTEDCALKVRTFDGTTIYAVFPSDQTLHKHVRAWIDESIINLKEPYEFKVLLAPVPNRRISASEEEESLLSLGLTPSATLIMVPITSYATAYDERWPGIISSTVSLGRGIVSTGYGIASGGLTMASNVVGSIFGRGESNPQTEDKPQSTKTSSSGTRVKTLADQKRDWDDQQLYNGNQLNFERRRDDDEEN